MNLDGQRSGGTVRRARVVVASKQQATSKQPRNACQYSTLGWAQSQITDGRGGGGEDCGEVQEIDVDNWGVSKFD